MYWAEIMRYIIAIKGLNRAECSQLKKRKNQANIDNQLWLSVELRGNTFQDYLRYFQNVWGDLKINSNAAIQNNSSSSLLPFYTNYFLNNTSLPYLLKFHIYDWNLDSSSNVFVNFLTNNSSLFNHRKKLLSPVKGF